MPSYPLRYTKNVQRFLTIVHELINIYQTDSNKIFKDCVSGIPIDIYDKILELSGSKATTKSWSVNYIECIAMSKKVVSALTYIEKLERKAYAQQLANYEHHYGNSISNPYIISTISSPLSTTDYT